MDVHDALTHNPLVPTYAIRILPGNPKWEPFFPKGSLVNSPNYRVINQYVFDDVDPDYNPDPKNNVMFNEAIATKMLTDFRDGRDGCSALLTHCTMGRNRSPAVAIALNVIFCLDQDPAMMKEKYSLYTRWVYHGLIETAKKIGIAR